MRTWSGEKEGRDDRLALAAAIWNFGAEVPESEVAV
jgi:hypothetical protein